MYTMSAFKTVSVKRKGQTFICLLYIFPEYHELGQSQQAGNITLQEACGLD